MAECFVPGCPRPIVVREQGWCQAHYRRWRRRGTIHDLTPEDLFFAHVSQAGDCWIWTAGTVGDGYGKFCTNKQTLLAHRWAYEFLRADIPAGLKLDHLCRNPICVNPWHLEPVTQRVNLLRSSNFIAKNAVKTHCKHGHPFDVVNTYVDGRGRRSCRICRDAANKRYQLRRAAGARNGQR